jgi:thiol-disulfide isomerase/thioredoxin
MKKILVATLSILFFLTLTGCGVQMATQTEQNIVSQQIEPYKLIELKDLNTNQTYTLEDFEDKIVLIESFAIWCPTCKSQQKELKKLHKLNSEIISISLDTDQNEEESEVIDYINKNNFDWIYSISPEELTSYFISDYGISFVSAPSVPILLKCPYTKPRLLKNGFKSTDYLLEEISKCKKILNKKNNKLENITPININTMDNSFDNEEIFTLKNMTKYIIHPDKIQSGGVSKGNIGKDGGIPALDENNIKFVTPLDANNWIKDNELILKLNYNGEIRIYPFQILVFHEIVNDIINDEPIAVTYCPLCGTGIAYKRKININGSQKIVKFGVSGKLYNSNLIMYDTLTNTYWQQINGKAIVGELTGQILTPFEVNTLSWRKFKETKDYNDNTKVLSQDTGIKRNYGNDPYGTYYEESYLLFTPKNLDKRINLKEIIYGIEINKQFKAYKHNDIITNKEIIDTINNTQIKITYNKDNEIIFTNLDTNEIIIKERGMWFSWYAFHPTTSLWEESNN